MRPDLEAELARAAALVRKAHVDRMVALGVSVGSMKRLFVRAPVFGLERVLPTGDRLFVPDEAGTWVVIVPVLEPRPCPISGDPCGEAELIDLVAFSTDRPLRWRRRTGEGWALRAELLEQDAPVNLVASPLEWMREGGEGMCFLEPLSWRRWLQLKDGPPLVTEDEMLSRRLNAEFVKSVPRPVIVTKFEARQPRRTRA